MSSLQHVLQKFSSARQELIDKLKENVALAWLHLEGEIKDKTPVSVDWGTLQSSINTSDTKMVGTKIIVEVW